MMGVQGHLLAVLIGALVGGIAFWLFVPGFFWAGLIGGTMMGAALRVAWVLITADDGA